MKNSYNAEPDDLPPNNKKFRVLGGAGRVLPHSLEAEAYLISCCLMDGGLVVKRCLDAKVTPAAYYLAAHRIIFECILSLHARSLPVTIDVVAEELKRSNQLDMIGGYEFLGQVSETIPTTAQAGYFIETIVTLAVLRRIIRDGTEVVDQAHDYDGDLEAYTSAVASKFQKIADFVSARTRKITQRGAATAAKLEALEVAAGKVDKSRWLHFPVPKMDQGFLPIDVRQEDWLNLLAAPPSGGKSSFLRWLASEWLYQGKKGVVFLLETSAKRWLQALAASYAGVNLRLLEETKAIFPDRFAEFERWMEVIEEWMEERLWVFDNVLGLEDIERVTRELDRKLREQEISAGVDEADAHGLSFVIGDYLQIVKTRTQFFKRTEQLAHISGSLKQLHRSLNVPGFWGAQITREARNDGRAPVMADLGESASLDQNADRIMFVHVPTNSGDGEDERPNSGSIIRVEVWQRKSRNGPKDVVIELDFDRPLSRFDDRSRKLFSSRKNEPPSTGGGSISKGDFR